MSAHAIYGLGWVLFGLTHSLLAGRQWLGCWSRIVYNIIALAQFGALAALGSWSLGQAPSFALPVWLTVFMGIVHLVGWAVLLYSARFYDLGRLGGLTQLRSPYQPEDEELHQNGPHAWVRHPLYAGVFLILWGAALSPLGLTTACWGSLYLLIGTWCEERRLLRCYGEAYRAYQRRVHAFLPWRGRTG